MKIILIFTMLVFTTALYSQELVTNDFEKGYVKDGKKYSVWEYYNNKHELELKIDHTSGRVYFIKNDTSEYVIRRDGEWVSQKLKVYPIPVEGSANFYSSLQQKIRYPALARRMGIEGEVIVMFEVDTLGFSSNYTVVKDIGADCGKELIKVLRETSTLWIPAQMNQRNYTSRFILSVVFFLDQTPNSIKFSDLPLAKKLNTIMCTAVGQGQPIPIHSITLTHPVKTYQSLEEALGSSEKVERLSLAGSNVNNNPGCISKLTYLKFLDLERTGLTNLPGEISELSKLEELYAPFNQIKNFPNGMNSLNSLKILGVASNQFSEFPEQICSLPKLEVLDLGDNQISELPPCIAELRKLRLIILQNNNLTTLPDELFELKKLEKIHLNGNPLGKEIIERIKSSFHKAELIID